MLKTSLYNKSALLHEFVFTTSKSSGKGGQHVNKTESRVELRWNFNTSSGISDEQKMLLSQISSVHIVDESIIHFASELSRSQIKNKEDVIQKTFDFLDKKLTVAKKRKPTKISKAAKRKRIESKKRRSEIKTNRRKL